MDILDDMGVSKIFLKSELIL